jgi:large subunit ribosomal protein L24
MARIRHQAPERHRIRLVKGDLVEVIAGKDADPAKRGKVLEILPTKNRVIVQGVNFVKKHTKPNPTRKIKGGIAEREASIHVSNVQIVCPECNKRTRIGWKADADGAKSRVCRKCGGTLGK